MKKFLIVCMIISMILCSSCTASGNAEITTPAPETTEAPTPPPAPIENQIFKDGSTEYVIVFSDPALAGRANNLSSEIRKAYGVHVPATSILALADMPEKIIALGDVDGVSHSLELKTNGDFQIKIAEDTVWMVAKNELAYDFLIEYALREIFSRTDNGSLTLTEEDSILYSDSELFSTTYVDYWKEKNGDVTKAFSAEICEEYYFEGKYGIKMAYRLYLPSNYDENKDYPVFVYLHGAGHRGNDNIATVSNIVYNFFNHKNVPMDETIVLIPQCPTGMQWVDYSWSKGNYHLKQVEESAAAKTLTDLIYRVKAEYSTDESRYYIYGMSMGGYGTWDIVARHPELFAAAYPVCGGGPIDAVNILKDIPIRTAHSDDDTTVQFAGTEQMVNAIIAAGGENIHFKRLTGYNHAIGTVTASDSEAFEWLFSQKK